MKLRAVLFFISLSILTTAKAANWSYDLGASTGTYNNLGYTEITVGLNYYLSESFIFRNAVFSRNGSQMDSVLGLDSSLRYVFDSSPEKGELGFAIFAGPGYRFASEKYSGVFVEGGAVIKFGGLSVGAGVKSLTYANPATRADGTPLAKSDTVVFIILAGGGAF